MKNEKLQNLLNRLQKGLEFKLDPMKDNKERIEFLLWSFRESNLPDDLCRGIASWATTKYSL